ncbi:AAA family ATPase [Lentzea tibetensis]|uniref:AAA family ATPase n=1 Tax=Lentzea tibetensis TaxID=2591470 RepID=A0A563ERW5_9PSEU|nr:AfsR/SARP family transcriptional regulator [Lentzea tibetensis]TWP50399.1 AAA family ATPase [Lentzea tibetensis]
MIEISLLGALKVCRDGEDVTPSAPKLRRVLALLVLNANSLVTVEQLCEEMWEGGMPPSAATTLQTYIYQLRRRLRLTSESALPTRQGSGEAGRQPALLTKVGGYELRLGPGEITDIDRFDRLVTKGRVALEAADYHTAASSLTEALGVWRGGALMDVSASQRLDAWRTQLEERRKRALEQRFSAELQLDRHQDVLEELAGLVRMNPTHEGFTGLLMVALYRCGRRTEALEVFRAARGRLVEELGLEPTNKLRRLHEAMLAEDPGLFVTPVATQRVEARAAVVPRQLPPDLPGFVGREHELGRIADQLGKTPANGAAAMRVVEIHGPPGAGKTALATRAAHKLRPEFPDGQLYVDLAGVDAGSVPLSNALAACLSACGFARETLPTGLGELSALFRTWTADRRVLIVVDDVFTASQVRPLMPGGSGCALIVSYRYRRDTLSIGEQIDLAPLRENEAELMFDRIVGPQRRSAEPDAVRELIRLCGRLPLTVRAVAVKLASRSSKIVAHLLDRMIADELLLSELPGGAQSLLGTVESSFRNLPVHCRAVLRVLVRGDRMRWEACEVATRAGIEAEDAAAALEYLVDVYLLDERETGYVVPELLKPALKLLLEQERHAEGGVLVPLPVVVAQAAPGKSSVVFG